MKLRYSLMVLVLALVSESAVAQGRGGRGGSGRSHSGSVGQRQRSSGGSSAFSHRERGRSAVSHSSFGFNRAFRQPRAGTGRGTFFYRSYGRPTYRSYGSYYRPRFYASFSFGRPYYYDSYYYGGYYPAYYPPYTPPYVDYDYGYDYRSRDALPRDDGYASRDRYAESARYQEDAGRVRLQVLPADATVYVDGEFRGSARQLTALSVSPGRHRIEVVRPGFRTEDRELDVARGETRVVSIELLRP